LYFKAAQLWYSEKSIFSRWKNTKKKVINHKGTRMVKDGKD